MTYTRYNLWDVVEGKNYYQWTEAWLKKFIATDSILVPQIAKKGSDKADSLDSHLIGDGVLGLGTQWGSKVPTSGQNILNVKLAIEKKQQYLLASGTSAHVSIEESPEEFADGIKDEVWFNKEEPITDIDMQNDLKYRAKHIIDNSDVVISLRKNNEVPHNFYKRDLDRIDPVKITNEEIDPSVWETAGIQYHHVASSGCWLFMSLDAPGTYIITISNYAPRFGGGYGARYHGKSSYTIELG